MQITRIIGDVSEGNAFLYGSDLLVDCGTPPSNTGFKIDILIKVIMKLYCAIRKGQLKHIVITHLHYDHGRAAVVMALYHGAVIYTSRLGKVMLTRWAAEDGLGLPEIKVFENQVPFQTGEYKITPYKMPHSILETYCFVITAGGKKVFHCTDFKLTGYKESSRAKSIKLLKKIGAQGIDLLVMDALGVDRSGFTLSEDRVVDNLVRLILEKPDSCHFVLMFASNSERILHIWRALQKYGVRVKFRGFAMNRMMKDIEALIGGSLCCLNAPRNQARITVVFTSGCQCEENAAVWRVADKEMEPGDRVYFSSTFIPEQDNKTREQKIKRFQTLIRCLTKDGVEVVLHEGQPELLGVNAREELIHVSGHEAREGKKEIVKAVYPNWVAPFHGSKIHYKLFDEMMNEVNRECNKEIFVVKLARNQPVSI